MHVVVDRILAGRSHYWKQQRYRGSFILPRASPRQRTTFGKGFFAEGRALGREKPSVKAHLCRGLALGKEGALGGVGPE